MAFRVAASAGGGPLCCHSGGTLPQTADGTDDARLVACVRCEFATRSFVDWKRKYGIGWVIHEEHPDNRVSPQKESEIASMRTPRSLHEPLRDALIAKDHDTVLRLLKEGANPSELVRQRLVLSNKHLLSYTPLAIATLTNNMPLLDARASTESTYSLNCGAQRVEHVFYAGTPAVVHANVDMLNLLVSHGMDLCALAPVNKANRLKKRPRRQVSWVGAGALA